VSTAIPCLPLNLTITLLRSSSSGKQCNFSLVQCHGLQDSLSVSVFNALAILWVVLWCEQSLPSFKLLVARDRVGVETNSIAPPVRESSRPDIQQASLPVRSSLYCRSSSMISLEFVVLGCDVLLPPYTWVSSNAFSPVFGEDLSCADP